MLFCFGKALANSGRGHGIEAHACLRRLVEKYINPLLEPHYELKQQEGTSREDLNEIQEVIRGKDFSSKGRTYEYSTTNNN
jgi:hypothetical protein